MARERSVEITLTDEQIATMLDGSGGSSSIGGSLLDLLDQDYLQETLTALISQPGYSRSTLRALLVLTAFRDDGARELTAIARELRLSTSTTHRYLNTWVAVGLIHRHPQTRKYRRMAIRRVRPKSP